MGGQRDLFLGVDIGGTKIALAVAAAGEAEPVRSTRYPAERERGPGEMIDRMIAEAKTLLAASDGELAGIGIACGGPLDRKTGTVLGPPNLPGWDRVPIVARLSRALGAPARLDNDANVAALGEHRDGAGKGARDMVYVTISTGIGAGVIVNGALVHGVAEGAGELGHVPIAPDGPPCGCGSRGCLEALASGTAIGRRAREAALARPEEAIALVARAGGDARAITAEHVAEVSATGDALASELWAASMEHLGTGLAVAVSVLAPERIVLGGGVTRAGDRLLEPVREAMWRRARMVPRGSVEVVLAALGQDSGVRGAVALAREAALARTEE